jgi:DNA-binding MarR family transcriptional regulator
MGKGPRPSPLSHRELVAALGDALRHMSTATVLFHQSIAERIGLNATDHKGLDLILRFGPLTAGELARRAGLSTGGVTGILDRLERAGLAHRERDPKDRRRVIIRADAARVERVVVPLFESLGKSTERMLAPYSVAELSLILGFIQRSTAMLAEETAE